MKFACVVDEVAPSTDTDGHETLSTVRIVLLRLDAASSAPITLATLDPPTAQSLTTLTDPDGTIPESHMDSDLLPPSSVWLRGKPVSINSTETTNDNNESHVVQIGLRFFLCKSLVVKQKILEFGSGSVLQIVARLEGIVKASTTAAAAPSLIGTSGDVIAPAAELNQKLNELEADEDVIQLLFTAIRQNQVLDVKLKAAEKAQAETLEKLGILQRRLDLQKGNVATAADK
ncbi:hypothetical protein HDU99_004375, partial [Rhizoclosmatium hyalinum]